MDALRRVLFVTYYFPPSGGPGVQRSLKFTKYLPDFGWLPTVLTVQPEQASFPDLDPDLGEEVPLEVDVERTFAWDPYALYARVLNKRKEDVVSVGFLGEAQMNARQRIARWVRANLFLPDARVGWVPFAIRRGDDLLRRGAYDAILTTGPPHSAHLVGLVLAWRYRLPWLTDFRDPWTETDYYAELPMTGLARAVDTVLERLVLRRSTAVTVVSDAMRRQLSPSAGGAPVQVIGNGFDPADFDRGGGDERSAASGSHLVGEPMLDFDSDVSDVAEHELGDRDADAAEIRPDEIRPEEDVRGGPGEREPEFVLAHVGNLNGARNPEALWQALARLDADAATPSLRVQLVGNVEPAVLSSAARYGIADRIRTMPYVPHAEAVRRMMDSTMLLLAINKVKGAEGIVTGKVYEYVASGRPVLGIGPPDGDAARVLRESGAGVLFDFEDASGIAGYLRRSYEAWKAGRRLRGATPDSARPYSRREQAGELAGLLEHLTAARQTAGDTASGERASTNNAAD